MRDIVRIHASSGTTGKPTVVGYTRDDISIWSEEMRQRIEKLTGVSALDIYGLSEIIGPGVSSECECKCGLHIFEDHFYPEIIDPVTEKVKGPGEIRVLERLRANIRERIKGLLGLSARVTLVEPGSIERSAGKAKRVRDLR